MKKRRVERSSGMEEVERSLHSSFTSAANLISQLYTQAQQQHKVAFLAGQRHGMEKIFEFIQAQHVAGTTPTTSDILSYLRNELDSLAQADMVIAQVQNQPAGGSLMLPPFGRVGTPADQQKPTFPTGFPTGSFTG